MKRRCCSIILAMAFVVLTGCRPASQQNIAGKLVTEMTITCQTCNDFTRRYYNTNEKMQLILLYIRDLGPRFRPSEDPEALSGRVICITMTCADGTKKIYRQKDDLYFQVGTDDWTRIDPERGNALWRIVLHTPSDPEPDSLRRRSLPHYRR